MNAQPAPAETKPSRAHARVSEEPAVSHPRLALSKAEAAETLGVSVDFFEQHVQPELRIVYRGRRRLVAVRELERWLEESATRTIGGAA